MLVQVALGVAHRQAAAAQTQPSGARPVSLHLSYNVHWGASDLIQTIVTGTAEEWQHMVVGLVQHGRAAVMHLCVATAPIVGTLVHAGFGSFGAVGFSYGGEAAATGVEAGFDASDDSEDESEEEDGAGRVTVDAEVRLPHAY